MGVLLGTPEQDGHCPWGTLGQDRRCPWGYSWAPLGKTDTAHEVLLGKTDAAHGGTPVQDRHLVHLGIPGQEICLQTLFRTGVSGGPGSKKGRLVSELVETYGFSFINVEKLLLDHLLKKVPENERIGASFDAQSVIKVSTVICMLWGNCQC